MGNGVNERFDFSESLPNLVRAIDAAHAHGDFPGRTRPEAKTGAAAAGQQVRAQAGGAGVGAAFAQGMRRGLFSNEAGLGSAPNVAATAYVKHPVSQGISQMLSVFIDTIVICTCTAFIIAPISSCRFIASIGVWMSPSARLRIRYVIRRMGLLRPSA